MDLGPISNFKGYYKLKAAATKGGKLRTGIDFLPPMNAMFTVTHPKKDTRGGFKMMGLNPEMVLPDEFDWRNKEDVVKNRFFSSVPADAIPSLSTPLDQGKCGACYIIAALTHFDDRYRLFSAPGSKFQAVVSPTSSVQSQTADGISSSIQQYLDCLANACEGGHPYDVILDLETKGVINASDQGYTGNPGKCTPIQIPVRKAKKGESYTYGDDSLPRSQQLIKDEIYAHGPVAVGYMVFSDFMEYKPGVVYRHTKGTPEGLHAVVCVGWGKDYWIIRNSWGPSWGDSGYFKIGFGECGIDSYALTNFMKMQMKKFMAGVRELKYGGCISAVPDLPIIIPEKMKAAMRSTESMGFSFSGISAWPWWFKVSISVIIIAVILVLLMGSGKRFEKK